MKRPLQSIRGSDSVGGISESDAVRRTNKKKGFSSDSLPPEQQLPTSSKSSPVRGSDSSEDPLDSQPDSQPQKTTKTPRVEVEKDGTVTVSVTQLHDMVRVKSEKDTAEIRSKVDELNTQLRQFQLEANQVREEADKQKQEYEQKLAEEKEQRDRLAEVFTQFGYTPPVDVAPKNTGVYITPSRGGLHKRDALREYNRILDDYSLTRASTVTTPLGEIFVQRDMRAAERFIRQNREVMRDAMTDLAQKAGWLKGRVSNYNKDDVTTFLSLPPALQTYLSTVVRMEHSARFVLWQFVNRSIYTGVPAEQSVQIPRVKHLTQGATSAAYRLTPGTPTTADREALVGGGINLTIAENGRGQNALLKPVALADMVMAADLLDVEMILQDRLGYDYHTFEDLLIFELLLSTTSVVYNSLGGVESAPANVQPGTATAPSGVVTLNFLGSLRAHMSNLMIPPLPDGCYIYVGPPDHINQLESDMQVHHQYSQPGDVEALTNMLTMRTRNEYSGRLSGYKGRIRGFHVFEATSFSTGIPGTPGVQAENLGGVATTTRSGFAMGADVIGWATALPMEIREDPDNNFRRIRSFNWVSHENATGLDIDPNRVLLAHESPRPVNGEEQLRVLEVRASTVQV